MEEQRGRGRGVVVVAAAAVVRDSARVLYRLNKDGFGKTLDQMSLQHCVVFL